MHFTNFDFASLLVTGSAAFCAKFASYPFDTIKVRLQVGPNISSNAAKSTEILHYSGTLDCIKKIFDKEGIRGFYKGIGAPLIGFTPLLFTSAASFSIGLRFFTKQEPTMFNILCAGAFSGICTTIIIVPVDRIKCLLQMQSEDATPKYKNSVDCLQKLYAENNLNGLYKGFKATLLREIPASGFYYTTLISVLSIEDMWFKYDCFLWSAITAGIAYWLVGMPFDVLKTHIQIDPEVRSKSVKEVYEQFVKSEGLFALYRGILPAMIQVFVVNKVFFSATKFFSQYF